MHRRFVAGAIAALMANPRPVLAQISGPVDPDQGLAGSARPNGHADHGTCPAGQELRCRCRRRRTRR